MTETICTLWLDNRRGILTDEESESEYVNGCTMAKLEIEVQW